MSEGGRVFRPEFGRLPAGEAMPDDATDAPQRVFVPEAGVGEFTEDTGTDARDATRSIDSSVEPVGMCGAWWTALAVAIGSLLVLVALALDWLVGLFPRQPVIGAIGTAGVALAVVGLAAAAWREWWALRTLGRADVTRAAVIAARTDRVALRRALDVAAERLAENGPAYGRLPNARRRALTEWRRVSRTTDTAEGLESEFGRVMLRELDKQAIAAVQTSAKTAGGAVMLSPSPAADLALFTWAALRLLRKIAATYGLRPGRAAELRLLRRVLSDASLIVVADVAGDVLASSTSRVLGMVVGRAAEGSNAGYRMARFGLVAIAACRPVPFSARDEPGLWTVLTEKRPSPMRSRGEEARL